jgi:hypothetical protein
MGRPAAARASFKARGGSAQRGIVRESRGGARRGVQHQQLQVGGGSRGRVGVDCAKQRGRRCARQPESVPLLPAPPARRHHQWPSGFKFKSSSSSSCWGHWQGPGEPGPASARLEPSSCVRTLWHQCGASVRGQAVTVGGGGANMMAPALSWALVASMVCGGLGFAPSASSPTLAHFRRSSRLEKRLRGVYGPRPDAVAAVRRARGVPVSRSTPRPPSGIGDV